MVTTCKGNETGFVVLVFFTMLMVGASAQAGCASALMGLSPCLNYIGGNSSMPSSSCCSQVGNLIQTSPQCLCSLMSSNGYSFGGLTVNRTLALRLPGACKVQTPTISQCSSNDISGDTRALIPPTSSPSDSSSDVPAPAATSSPSGTEGSKTVPITSGNPPTGAGMILSFWIFILTLAIVASMSNF